MLASAFAYGKGVLPVAMLKAQAMDPVRKAIAIEAQAFVQRQDLDRLTPGLKEPAKKIIDWWVDAVAKEAELEEAARASTTTVDIAGLELASSIFVPNASNAQNAA
jgi:hypothetical protein